MLLVDTVLKPSEIHGIGLFAAQFIAKGTIVWEYRDGFDLRFSYADLESLPPTAQKKLHHYGYEPEPGLIEMCSDGAQFMNHSSNPNVAAPQPDQSICIAVRDIRAGEELTCDYVREDRSRMKQLG